MTIPRPRRPGALFRAHGITCCLIAVMLAAGLGHLCPPVASSASPERSQSANGSPQPGDIAQQQGTEAAIFSDDFDAYGDDSRWNVGQHFRAQSEIVSSGSHAARLINTGGYPVFGRKTLDATYPRLFVRLRFQVIELTSASSTLLNLRPGTTSSVIAIRIDSDGILSYITGATGITSTSTLATENRTWHELQLLVDTTTTTNNIRIWLDHAELTSLRQSAWLGEDGMHTLDLGDNSAGQRSDIVFDDVIVDDEFIATDRAGDPVSGTLIVRTFPAWSDIAFELEGNTFYSDDDGTVQIQVNRWSTDLRGRIKVNNSTGEDGSQATFSGWRGWHGSHSTDVFAAFRISEPVTFSFVDMSGAAIDPATIDSLTIKSKSGVIQTLTGAQLHVPVLINISSVVPGATGITSKTTEYVVDQVMIDGSNVVHRARQRSSFGTSRHWTISLLFYRVTFAARDAFFGSPLGTELVVRAADGSEQRIQMDANGSATIERLPRGEYTVAVLGGGYSPPRPIYVSRDQDIEMDVVSRLDLVLLGLTLATIVLGLIIIGRPFLVVRPLRFAGHRLRAAIGKRS